ncbi:hypothetical protein [Lepagella muris]|jgi:hypothetical protein|uniref:Uncharacterized protein n=1 Tax=Lepagella muris TaxID=3032870 RepID=A0AC61RH55_9BACT|nr:hypothetical protein [Lepagella muris]ROT08359.1 hypothetical protein EEL33_04720 [Muribaculaceae bacterium Isolate-037 (Harlan)]TGY79785.1 hypothetical protein E5331_05260 [Lepagella muris]THG51811.1 hypothetical protein E5984_09890 [Bacteroidales bacterium]TKC54403.1 hypothetical protein E5359_018285 [Bacteroidales bacterium]
MIYCITLIIVVALVCATRLYPLWVEHDRKQLAKAWELIRKMKEENAALQESCRKSVDEWVDNFNEQSKSFNQAWEKLYELAEKMNVKL